MSNRLSPALGSYPLTAVTADFAHFTATHHVLPDGFAAQFDASAQAVLHTAEELGIRTAEALLSQHKLVLRSLTGAVNLTARLPRDQREQIHLHRNVMLTLLLGATHAAGLGTDAIAETVITLTRRTQSADRPLEDDEIALLRTRAAINLYRGRSAQAATVYVLCDAGQELRETTAVTARDLDDSCAPTLLFAAGRRGLAERVLPLEGFHSAALAARLAATAASSQTTIAYCSRTNLPGSDQAMVSTYGVINRLLESVGLKQPDVTASSIRRWRIAHAFDTQGIDAAAQLAGRPVEDMARIAGRSLRVFEPEAPEDDDTRF